MTRNAASIPNDWQFAHCDNWKDSGHVVVPGIGTGVRHAPEAESILAQTIIEESVQEVELTANVYKVKQFCKNGKLFIGKF